MAAKVLKGEKLERELTRLEAMTQYKKEYEVYAYVCNIDEAERGPLTNPVVIDAVILLKDCRILYPNDSGKLSEKWRKELFEEIKEKTVAWSAGVVSPARIGEINILQTTYEAVRNVVGRSGVTPDVLLNDAVTIPGLPMKQMPIIKGDARGLPIVVISILAKVTGGHMMVECEEMFSGHGFAKYKGYGIAAHVQVTRELGPCPIHRRSFIRNFVEWGDE